MRRYLIVANQTLVAEPLVSRMRELARAAPSSFHVVVPATPPRDHLWTEGEARATARSRLDAALARFAELGAEVEGEVGDGNPMLAIGDALRDHGPFDEIVDLDAAEGALEVAQGRPPPSGGSVVRTPGHARGRGAGETNVRTSRLLAPMCRHVAETLGVRD